MSLLGYETDMLTALRNVRYRSNSGKHLLALSFSGFDPKATLPDAWRKEPLAR